MNKSNYILLALALTIIGLNQTSWVQGSRTIDSLSARLQKDVHDTDRVKLLNDLAWKLKFVNIDTAIILSTEARSISEAYPWPIGVARSIGYQGTFNYLIGEYAQSLEYYLEAVRINEELGDQKGIAINLGNIGIIYRNQSEESACCAQQRLFIVRV